jgi:four helix bundle protein
MLSFQKLDVYRAAIEFLALSHRTSAPSTRGNAELLDQLRRAATSVPLNIAEACGRTGPADVARFYAIARGSAMECAAIFDALAIRGALEGGAHEEGQELLERVVSMLTRMCR